MAKYSYAQYRAMLSVYRKKAVNLQKKLDKELSKRAALESALSKQSKKTKSDALGSSTATKKTTGTKTASKKNASQVKNPAPEATPPEQQAVQQAAAATQQNPVEQTPIQETVVETPEAPKTKTVSPTGAAAATAKAYPIGGARESLVNALYGAINKDKMLGRYAPAENLKGDALARAQQIYSAKTDEYNRLAQAVQDHTASMSDIGKLGVEAARQNPGKAAGLIGLGVGNVSGLLDNDKFGGQLGGAGLGFLASKLLETTSPYTATLMTLGGGQLGSLFDKLRAKKAQEKQMQQQQYNQYQR